MPATLKPIPPTGYRTRHAPGAGPFPADPVAPALVIRIHQLAIARARPSTPLYLDAIAAAARELIAQGGNADQIDLAALRYDTLRFCLSGKGFGCWDISALHHQDEAIPLCIAAATAPLGQSPEDVLEFFEDPFLELLGAIITLRDHAVGAARLDEARTTLRSLTACPTHDHLISQLEAWITNAEQRLATHARRLIA